MMKFIFGMQVNIKVFLQVDTIVRHAQSTQSKKLTYLAISPEKRGDEFDFVPVDKPESLQVDSITLGVRIEACPNNLK